MPTPFFRLDVDASAGIGGAEVRRSSGVAVAELDFGSAAQIVAYGETVAFLQPVYRRPFRDPAKVRGEGPVVNLVGDPDADELFRLEVAGLQT